MKKNYFIDYQKWCLRQRSLEYFKNHVIYRNRKITYKKLLEFYLKKHNITDVIIITPNGIF